MPLITCLNLTLSNLSYSLAPPFPATPSSQATGGAPVSALERLSSKEGTLQRIASKDGSATKGSARPTLSPYNVDPFLLVSLRHLTPFFSIGFFWFSKPVFVYLPDYMFVVVVTVQIYIVQDDWYFISFLSLPTPYNISASL